MFRWKKVIKSMENRLDNVIRTWYIKYIIKNQS